MRLLIVDDHELVREALRARLELIPDVEVVGSADNGASALTLVEELSPDAVILDFNMPQMNGADCACRIKEICPDCHILFLTGFPEDEALLDTVGLASGYVTKSASWGMLEQALEAIARGKAFVDPNLVPAIMNRAAATNQDQLALRQLDPDQRLTTMEGRVAVLAARGRSNQAIATTLTMSENTVKAHLQRVFRKLGVHAREELAARLH
ncbi:MAG: response regulator transcription factor [Armatimonadetes bacterium]|jgi:NarL family two-component system response regulator YdfI|nr:response regulator transcription factor [Armatimonadota bacterium]